MKNPYELLTNDKFWKTAVSSVKINEGFDNIWKPKFAITKKSKIATLGSCFAQHISHWLIENGYSWQNAEPGPNNFSNEELLDLGYNIFSCRVGNIYTSAMLKQWIKLATEPDFSIDEIYCENTRFYDPLRPQIPSKGFASKDELELARITTLTSLNSLLLNSDVIIFTMGLTEGWINNNNGNIYQVCPGTIKGDFNSEIHSFINYTYDDIKRDMLFIIDRLNIINKNIKILLTVSPVPLTATASQNHVLPATVYSKSVLRAVAGDLVEIYPNVDYFPSYELIVSNATKNNFFEENLRTVKPEGIQYVMNHFGICLGIFSKSIFLDRSRKFSSHEEYCDEILIESWNKNKINIVNEGNEAYIDYCLIGDSQMGALSKAFSDLNINHAGGMIMNGSAWTSNLVHLDDNEIFVPLEDFESRARWTSLLPFIKSPNCKRRIILNIGMQTHRSVSFFINYCNENKIMSVTPALFSDYYIKENFKKIEIVKKLLQIGHHCLIVSDPPTRELNTEIKSMINFWTFYDENSLKIFHDMGCDTFNAGLYFQMENFDNEFFSDIVYADGKRDWFHGSEKYYSQLATVIKSHCFL